MCVFFEGINPISTESLKEKSSEVVARVFTAEADKHAICRSGRMRYRRTAPDDEYINHCKSCEGAKEGQWFPPTFHLLGSTETLSLIKYVTWLLAHRSCREIRIKVHYHQLKLSKKVHRLLEGSSQK